MNADFAKSHCRLVRHSTGQRKLRDAAFGKGAPVCLITLGTSVASALWLPRLVKCLEVENIHSPGERCTDTGLEESLLVQSACLSITIVRSPYEKLVTSQRDMIEACHTPSPGQPVSPFQISMVSTPTMR